MPTGDKCSGLALGLLSAIVIVNDELTDNDEGVDLSAWNVVDQLWLLSR